MKKMFFWALIFACLFQAGNAFANTTKTAFGVPGIQIKTDSDKKITAGLVMQIKVFSSTSPSNVEKMVNEWLGALAAETNAFFDIITMMQSQSGEGKSNHQIFTMTIVYYQPVKKV